MWPGYWTHVIFLGLRLLAAIWHWMYQDLETFCVDTKKLFRSSQTYFTSPNSNNWQSQIDSINTMEGGGD